MSNDIKAGDLVMVIKPTPCCKSTSHMGAVFTVASIANLRCSCGLCGHLFRGATPITEGPNGFVLVSCLKKIDPPADGASLPMREDVGVAA